MKNILLVEDDPFIIDIYSNHLKKEGFKVDIAVDGQMALDKIKNHYPDLVLLDLILPKMGGWEVLEQLRQDPATKNIKVIVTSNLNRQEDTEKVGRFGVLKYFLKVETTPEDISNAVREILN